MGGPTASGLGEELTTSHHKKEYVRSALQALGLGEVFWNDPLNKKQMRF